MKYKIVRWAVLIGSLYVVMGVYFFIDFGDNAVGIRYVKYSDCEYEYSMADNRTWGSTDVLIPEKVMCRLPSFLNGTDSYQTLTGVIPTIWYPYDLILRMSKYKCSIRHGCVYNVISEKDAYKTVHENKLIYKTREWGY